MWDAIGEVSWSYAVHSFINEIKVVKVILTINVPIKLSWFSILNSRDSFVTLLLEMPFHRNYAVGTLWAMGPICIVGVLIFAISRPLVALLNYALKGQSSHFILQRDAFSIH